jgi:predicted nucleic acid-binding Zn ribbon protein
MPTYEFRAPDGTIIERIFKISEVPDSVTLNDGRVATRIISGGAGLLFKGSGFYITDYGKDGKKDQRAAAGSSSGGDSGSKSDASSKSDGASGSTSSTKSDSKPAASPAASSTKSD